MANPTIGNITCPFTGEIAEVRRYSTGSKLFYFVSPAGMITPNLPHGQKYMRENTTFFDTPQKGAPVRELDKVTPAKPSSEPSSDAKPTEKQPETKSLWEYLTDD